jgi:hypothetical protein
MALRSSHVSFSMASHRTPMDSGPHLAIGSSPNFPTPSLASLILLANSQTSSMAIAATSKSHQPYSKIFPLYCERVFWTRQKSKRNRTRRTRRGERHHDPRLHRACMARSMTDCSALWGVKRLGVVMQQRNWFNPWWMAREISWRYVYRYRSSMVCPFSALCSTLA